MIIWHFDSTFEALSLTEVTNYAFLLFFFYIVMTIFILFSRKSHRYDISAWPNPGNTIAMLFRRRPLSVSIRRSKLIWSEQRTIVVEIFQKNPKNKQTINKQEQQKQNNNNNKNKKTTNQPTNKNHVK